MEELELRIQKVLVNKIKEDVYNLIKNNNGKLDLVDVTCNFKEYTVDIPLMAVRLLKQEGRVEQREAVWNIQPYRLFAI